MPDAQTWGPNDPAPRDVTAVVDERDITWRLTDMDGEGDMRWQEQLITHYPSTDRDPGNGVVTGGRLASDWADIFDCVDGPLRAATEAEATTWAEHWMSEPLEGADRG